MEAVEQDDRGAFSAQIAGLPRREEPFSRVTIRETALFDKCAADGTLEPGGAAVAGPARQFWRSRLSLAHPDATALPVEQIVDGHVFVTQRDGLIVGFAALLARPDGNADVDALFVEPSLWKRGVGRLLVEHCADAARGRASRILHVVGNPHAEGFYAACGFSRTGTVEIRFGPGLAMQRGL